MIKTAYLFLAFLFACSSPLEQEGPDGPEELVLGTAQQGIVWPFRFGFEGGDRSACDVTWTDPGKSSGGSCWMPDSKQLYATFTARTCSAWWQARFVEVWYDTTEGDLPFANDRQHADAPPWEMLARPTGRNMALTHEWLCSTERGIGAASYVAVTSNVDSHAKSPEGTLQQYKGGRLKVYTTEIESTPEWASATDTQRQRYARNIIRARVALMFGNGDDQVSALTKVDHPNFFLNEYYMTEDQLQRMACYNAADGGLFSDCQ